MQSADVAALIGFILCGLLLIAAVNWYRADVSMRRHASWLIALSALASLQALEFLYHTTELYTRLPIFIKVPDPFVVLIPFTIYGFIRSIQGDIRPLRLKPFLVHLSPALMVAMLDVPFWLLSAEERIHWMQVSAPNESLWRPLAPYGNTYLAIIGVLSFGYWFLQWRQGVLSSRSIVRHWVKRFQVLQVMVFLTLFLRIALSSQEEIYISMAYALAPVSAYLLYLLLSQSQLPQPVIDPLTEQHDVRTTESSTPQRNVISNPAPEMVAIFVELEHVMTKELYKENGLSLGQLASQTGFTTHQISAAINQCSGSNFYDWLNTYRVSAAEKLLAQPELTITQVCYAVGFNSKSTFNTAFKKFNQCTPSEYRKLNG